MRQSSRSFRACLRYVGRSDHWHTRHVLDCARLLDMPRTMMCGHPSRRHRLAGACWYNHKKSTIGLQRLPNLLVPLRLLRFCFSP